MTNFSLATRSWKISNRVSSSESNLLSSHVDDLYVKTHVSHCLEVLDDAATTFRSEHIFVLKAKGRTRFFLRTFHWTGGDTFHEPELECDYDQWGHPNHKLHGPIIKDGKWFTILIDLGRTLEINDLEMVHFRQNLHSLEGKFEPFLTHSIQHGGVENVNLKVILPSVMMRKVTYSETNSESGHVLSSEIIQPEITEGRSCYAKVRDLKGTETNLKLRLDW